MRGFADFSWRLSLSLPLLGVLPTIYILTIFTASQLEQSLYNLTLHVSLEVQY